MRRLCLALMIAPAVAIGQAPTEWTSTGIGGGGALFAPTWSRYNAEELTLACDMSGQYRSTDTGRTWKMTPFMKLQSGRTAQKVQYTNDPLVQYNVDFAFDLRKPVRTLDGGLTWQGFPVDPTDSDAWAMEADPNNKNRILLASYNRLYLSTNGGTSWTQKAEDNTGNGFHVAGAFWDGNNIYVGTQGGVLVSTNGGTTFNMASVGGIPSTQNIVSFAGGKASNGKVRFYCVTLGAGDVYSGVMGDDHWNYQSVYTILWGSANWQPRGANIPAGTHPFYVDMANNQITTVYLGGGSEDGVPTVLRSTDSGINWSSLFQANNNQNITTGWSGDGGDRGWGYGELVFGFDVSPTNSKRVAFTDFGFCHVSVDSGATWRQTYVRSVDQNPMGVDTPKGKGYRTSGIENTSSWSVCFTDTKNIWIGYSDIRGIRSSNSGSTWSYDYTGFTTNSAYRIVKHPTTGVLYMAQSGTHDMYESTHLTDSSINSGTGNVLFSQDKGKTWGQLGTLGRVVVDVAIDPTNATRLYAAVAHSTQGGIYVCNGIGSGGAVTWTKLANPPRTEGHANNIVVLNDGTLVATYSGRRTSNFTDSSGVFVSTNGGTSWTDKSHANMHWWTRDITIDPTDATQNTWYVGVYSGWGGTANGKGGLYRTTNRGTNWTKVFDSDRVSGGGVDPANGNYVFAATEVEGLWFSSNGKAATPSYSQVASFPFRHPQRIQFNPFKAGQVWITTFGGGTWTGQMGSGA